jgi:iron complex transport system ATP-binding protein
MKLKVKGLEFGYASMPVLADVCLELAQSEMLGIVGPNGAGKSTLIRCINRILNPQSGCILMDEMETKKMDRMELARKMGYIPQTASQIFPTTVFDAILLGRRPHIGWRSGEEDNEKVLDVLELLDIEDLAMRDIKELSGGQQQRVFIARALAQEPEVLLLDEPTSNLDIRHQLEVMEIIKDLVVKEGISAIMAIHDLNLASKYTDRVIIMKDGRIFDAGSPSDVLTPENIRSVYGVEAEVIRRADSNGGRPYIVPIRPLTTTTCQCKRWQFRDARYRRFRSLGVVAATCTSVIRGTVDQTIVVVIDSIAARRALGEAHIRTLHVPTGALRSWLP